jgi:hypothetical protein
MPHLRSLFSVPIHGLTLLTFSLAACGPSTPSAPIATFTSATPPAALQISLWLDFPVLHTTDTQAINIEVRDPAGRPIEGAYVVVILQAGKFKKTFHLPDTDSTGNSRANIDLTGLPAPAIVQVTAHVAADGHKGRPVETDFELRP